MKKLSILILVCAFLIQGCKKESADEVSNNPSGAQNVDASVAVAKERLVAFIKKQKLLKPNDNKNLTESIQGREGARQGFKRNADRENYAAFIRNVIDPSNYECGPTVIDQYVSEKISTWTDEDFEVYFGFSYLVFDYAYLFQNSDATGIPYFGENGQYNNVASKTFRDLKKFWDIPSDIYLTSSHGNFFNDVAKVVILFQFYREMEWIDPATTDSEIAEIAGYIKLVFGSSSFQNFTNPLLTFNAFAAPEDPFFNTPKKIVMGDGIQRVYEDLGYGDVAPQAILAHEYAHHVQFANPLLVQFEYSAEGTRYTELMADAVAAYYLTHARGAAMNWHRVQSFLVVFFAIGDCAFDQPYHHGTPLQRMRAAKFGYDLAKSAANQGHILSSPQIIARFLAAYQAMIAPDGN